MPGCILLRLEFKFKRMQSITGSCTIAIDKLLRFMMHVGEIVQKPLKALTILRTNIINICLQTLDEEL